MKKEKNISRYTLEQIKKMASEGLAEGSVAADGGADEFESEFIGQPYAPTTLQEELAYNSFINFIDKDLLPAVKGWHNSNFRDNLNSAIRSYTQNIKPSQRPNT